MLCPDGIIHLQQDLHDSRVVSRKAIGAGRAPWLATASAWYEPDREYVKLELHIFQQYFTPPPHPWNKSRPKPPWVPSTPIILAHSTIPFSKCFESYVYIKKCADSGTQTNIVYFWRLQLERIQLPGLRKEYANNESWELKQHSLFLKATASKHHECANMGKVIRLKL
jgi:hypothetical protein